MARAHVTLPWFVTSRFMHAIQLAQDKKEGKPVFFAEIMVVLNKTYPNIPIKDTNKALAVAMSLIREDWVYVDEMGYYMSITRQEGLNTFTEIFRKHFGEKYAIDRTGALIPNGCVVRDLDEQIAFLKSKDAALWEREHKKIFDGEFRFLNGKPVKSHIAFLSYPRSGNSMMRRILEQATGLATGSNGTIHSGTTLQL